MSAAETRHCSTAGSLIALGAICTFGIVVTWKRFCAEIEDPEVPFGISRFATRTVPRAPSSPWRCCGGDSSRREPRQRPLRSRSLQRECRPCATCLPPFFKTWFIARR